MDWIGAIEQHTTAFCEVAASTDGSTPVPTCPGWVLDDLVWHLYEVQHFWHHVITHRPDPPSTYEEPVRASTLPQPDSMREISASLTEALRQAQPSDAAWSWSGPTHQNVGFTRRRQAHEAYVHLVDAVLAAGAPLPDVDRAFALDGLDEALSVFVAGNPAWSVFEPSDDFMQIGTSDGGACRRPLSIPTAILASSIASARSVEPAPSRNHTAEERFATLRQ